MFEIEQIRREKLESLQLERLKKIVAWAYEKSTFYQKAFRRHGVAPDDIQSLNDVCKLPFVTSEDIRGNESDILTLPLSGIVRVSRLGGIKKFYTKGDIRNSVEMLIRAFISTYVLRGSTVSLEGDLSDSRLLDVLYALESIGATVVLPGTENSGVDVTVRLKEDIVSYKNFNLFAPPEIGHAGLLYPCEAGYHVQEDHFLIEILNDELVVTALTAQAFPLIRYRTRQSAEKIFEPCPCRRTFTRIQLR